MAVLAIAYLWMHVGLESQRWSLFRQLGNNVAAGVLGSHRNRLWPLVRNLEGRSVGKPGAGVLTAALLALMTVLSVLRTRYTSLSAFLKPVPAPRRASGD